MPSLFAQMRHWFESNATPAHPADVTKTPCPGGFTDEDERARQAAPKDLVPGTGYRVPGADRYSPPRTFGEGPGPASPMRQNGFSRDDFGAPGRFY